MKIIAIGVVALLAGCVSTSDVVELGRDSYMVGSTTRGGGMSRTEVSALSIKRANEFCASKGKIMSVDHIATSGIIGWTARESELTFLCLNEDDPSNRRIHLRKDPDAIVEIRK